MEKLYKKEWDSINENLEKDLNKIKDVVTESL